MHDIKGNVAVSGVGCVGDDCPAFCGCSCCSVTDCVVVVALDLQHLRAITRDGVAPTLADGFVHINDAAASKELRPPGDRPAVVTIRGARDGGGSDDIAVNAGQQFARGHAR